MTYYKVKARIVRAQRAAGDDDPTGNVISDPFEAEHRRALGHLEKTRF